MTKTYRTRLYRRGVDCGCPLSLGDFSEEADLDDIRRWLRDRGYMVTGPDTHDPRGGQPGSDRPVRPARSRCQPVA